MQDQSWADGYVVDIGYTHGFYRELTPALLRFVTQLAEVRAVDTDAPFTYYELGCGHGNSTALLAAANPNGRFIGVDFNPAHIHNARRLAQDTGTPNVEFLEKSFAELVSMDLPDADMITLHGVYSWVSAENRAHIVEFIRRRLKPAGIAYVSYNSLPGLSQVAPLQRLLNDHANQGTGPLPARIQRSLEFARKLQEAGADYFKVSPFAQHRLAAILGQDPSYLAHEYYNDQWTPFFHADVARELAAAKLGYAGSATVIENFEQFMQPPAIAGLVAQADPSMRETVKDFARNRVFRKDVFTRGAPRATPAEMEAMLGRTRFVLARPRAGCKLTEKTPAGDLTLQAEAYAPVLDALARSPMTFDELTRAPEVAGMPRPRVRQAVFGMAALGNVLPVPSAEGEAERRVATARFNKAVLAGPLTSGNTVLASPVWGTGMGINVFDRLLLSGPRKHGEAVEHALKAFLTGGGKAKKGDKVIDSLQETRAMIDERAAHFFSDLLPFFRQAGIAD